MCSVTAPRNIADGARAAAGHVGTWDKSGTVTAIAQVLLLVMFWLFDEIFIKTNFKCPCVEDGSCGRSFKYSVGFIAFTTILAALFGTAALFGITRRLCRKKEKAEQFDERSSSPPPAREGGQDIATTIPTPGAPQSSVHTEGHVQGTSSQNDEPERFSSPPPAREGGQDIATTIPTPAGAPQSSVHTEGHVQGTSSQNDEPDVWITIACSRRECCFVFLQFLFIAFAWLAILLIDGDYVACAGTCRPYGNANCSEVRATPEDQLPFSPEYMWVKRSVSQPIGIALAILVGIVILCSLYLHCKCTCCNCLSDCCQGDKSECRKLWNEFCECIKAIPRAVLRCIQCCFCSNPRCESDRCGCKCCCCECTCCAFQEAVDKNVIEEAKQILENEQEVYIVKKF